MCGSFFSYTTFPHNNEKRIMIYYSCGNCILTTLSGLNVGINFQEQSHLHNNRSSHILIFQSPKSPKSATHHKVSLEVIDFYWSSHTQYPTNITSDDYIWWHTLYVLHHTNAHRTASRNIYTTPLITGTCNNYSQT